MEEQRCGDQGQLEPCDNLGARARQQILRDLGLERGNRKDDAMQPSQESVEGRAGRAPVLTALHVVCAS